MDTKLALGSLVLTACALMTSHDVRACGNGVEHRINQTTRDVMVAESHSAVGRHTEAARVLLKRYPRIKGTRIGASGAGDRAVNTMAQAVIRSRGELDVGALFPGGTTAQREQNLAWSLHVLRTFSIQKPKDARATTNLAEAYAIFPEHQPEAKRLLTFLEDKDLVATAQGYAALADLRERSGEGKPAFLESPLRALDHARAVVARARCRDMTSIAGICDPRHTEDT